MTEPVTASRNDVVQWLAARLKRNANDRPIIRFCAEILLRVAETETDQIVLEGEAAAPLFQSYARHKKVAAKAAATRKARSAMKAV